MKTPICITCETPLKIKGKYAKFRCMCDEELRSVSLEIDMNQEVIKYLDNETHREDASSLIIKDFLTKSRNLIE